MDVVYSYTLSMSPYTEFKTENHINEEAFMDLHAYTETTSNTDCTAVRHFVILSLKTKAIDAW